ncbi:tyrosine-type recombinase/integrase [Streptomyces mirabilis]|uniref:tyrosine-type recombinase/integrase n=1 Tax=Streptomyces mirabilis TaxID=68239 RepID=UPI0031BA2702
MRSLDDVERDLGSIRLPRWGKVVPSDGVVPWLVVDPEGVPIEPVQRYLRDFVARNRPGSVRSYAYALLRWWRWLRVVQVEWDRATSAEVRDLVLWLKQTTKPRNSPRTKSASTAGTVNPITRKRNPGDQYQPRTIRHSNAVVRSFYEFWIETGHGPLVNPVPLDRRGNRPHAHHNPLDPFGPEGRIRYNPKIPKARPREIPDERWNDLFGALRSNRDRAILSLDISNATRASEVLGIRGVDLDWGDQLVQVSRKGSDDAQWLPASPDSFVWLRLYLAELAPLEPSDPIWWTLRRRDRGAGLRLQPMNYEALRAVFRRINAVLGTNYTMHDLRHTAALRMSRDKNLTLLDVQTILGHAHLSTTADVYLLEDEAAVIRRVAEHLAERELRAQQAPPPVAVGYEADDLAVLFGGLPR